MISRGIQIEEVKTEMEKFRQVIWECYNVAEGFFDRCRKLKITPVDMVDTFRQKLSQLAGTLDKFRSSHWAGHSPTKEQFSTQPTVTLVPPPQAVQYLADGSFAAAETLAPQGVAAPSEITKKTTTNTPSKSGQSGQNSHTQEGQSLKILPDQENSPELVKTLELNVIQDTQQEPKDQELNSQSQDCIFMREKFPCGGGENFEIENTPNWVLELEEKVRSGNTLPRSELLQLAQFRLGDLANVYRESGRVLDASPNDMKPEFLKFLQWYAFNRNPDISFVRASVNKAERNPEQWGVLLSWIETFQQVQNDPSVLETMLAAKVSSGGRKANSQDFELQFDLTAKKAMSVTNWWELV